MTSRDLRVPAPRLGRSRPAGDLARPRRRCGSAAGSDEQARPPGARDGARGAAELPRGGRRVLPDYRVVAYYGAPQSPSSARSASARPAGRAGRAAGEPYERGAPGAARASSSSRSSRAAHPGEGGTLRPAPGRRHHPALPARRAPGQGAVPARHPARALGLLHRDRRGSRTGSASPTSASRSTPKGGSARRGPGPGHRPRRARARSTPRLPGWPSSSDRGPARRSSSSSTSSPTTWSTTPS